MSSDNQSAVVTVRMSQALHDALVILAWSRRTTMNRLCVDVIEREVYTDDQATTAYRVAKARQEAA